MIRVKQITELDDLLKVWPRLLKLITVENAKADPSDTLHHFLDCFKHGAIFTVAGDYGVCGSACLTVAGDRAILHSLPKDDGKGYGKQCLTSIREWATRQGLTTIQVSTTKLSGSSYRYFEKSLGFRRKAVIFTLNLGSGVH